MAELENKHSIWIDDETRDDGTFDVIAYDEGAEETDWNLSRGHIATIEEAEAVLQGIIAANPHLLFERRPNQKK